MLILTACGGASDDVLLGTWQAQDKYYTGLYQIIDQDGELFGKVLYYDDGTTLYEFDIAKPKYIFEGLAYYKGVFVDAEARTTHKPSITLKVLHPDTLEVKLFVNYQPSTEIWVRKK